MGRLAGGPDAPCAEDRFDLIHNRDFQYDWKFAVQVAKDIATGMEYLHSLEPLIMHRDLKT